MRNYRIAIRIGESSGRHDDDVIVPLMRALNPELTCKVLKETNGFLFFLAEAFSLFALRPFARVKSGVSEMKEERTYLDANLLRSCYEHIPTAVRSISRQLWSPIHRLALTRTRSQPTK